MDYNEFKTLCITEFKKLYRKEELPTEFLNRFKKEVVKARSYYLDGIDLYEEFKSKKALNKYVLPYVLGFNKEYDLTKPMDLIQTKEGASGGIDIDSDFENSGRDLIIEYLKSKYGEDCVFPVGTFSMLGIKSAAKDLLKYYEVPFADSNAFTAILDNDISFEENIENIKVSNRQMYDFYLRNKDILDLTPKFVNKERQAGKHAGGVVVLPKPVYHYMPVERAGGGLVTAYPESGQVSTLDDIGVVKFDILSITVLDNIRETIDSIDEDLYLIEEDGIRKVVPYSYLVGKKVMK